MTVQNVGCSAICFGLYGAGSLFHWIVWYMRNDCTVTCYKYLRVVVSFFLFKNPYYILQLFPHAKSSWIKRDYPSAPQIHL